MKAEIMCADSRCLNKVKKLGEYCPACKEKQEKEERDMLAYIEKMTKK